MKKQKKDKVKSKNIQKKPDIPPHYHPMAFRPEDLVKLESFIVTIFNAITTQRALIPTLNSKLITERVKAQERIDQMAIVMDISRRQMQGEIISEEELNKYDFIIKVKPSEIAKK